MQKTILELAEPLVKATIALYHEVCRTFLPTPAKAHYLFNLRDVSKVFQGTLMVRQSSCQSNEAMVSSVFVLLYSVLALIFRFSTASVMDA